MAVTGVKSLTNLLQQGSVWRGSKSTLADAAVLSSGFCELDELIGGGWPKGALVEIISEASLGLSLLIPVLLKLSKQPYWLAWINSPYIPYAPRLQSLGIDTRKILLLRKLADEQALWAAEQALQSGNCKVVMLWPSKLNTAQIRRLQLAAETGDCLGVLFRPRSARALPSVAALRLQVEADEQALLLRLLKRRGGWSANTRLRICVG